MTITVKSVNNILADMIRKVVLDSPISDISEGSTIGTLLEAAALQDFQNQVAVLKVIESTNLQTLTGSDLDSKAREMNIPNGSGGIGRKPARKASGNIVISSSFQKKASALYIGKPAPFAGGLKVFVQDAAGWPSTGSIYIGRGTSSEEGPIPYVSIQDNVTFFTITLDSGSPLINNHLYTDSVILAQGGDRQIAAGTLVKAPQPAGSPPLLFAVDASATILDGDSSITVSVSAVEAGEDGNVAGNAINDFVSSPFSDASVSNPSSFSNGASSESDEELRSRIRDYISTLARGTKKAISSALLGLKDEETGKTITSLNIVEPADIGRPAKIYIDDGTGLEPTIVEQGFETLLVEASGQEVLFRTSHYPITPCTIVGTRTGPFSISDGMYLDVELDGVVERFTVYQSQYNNLLSVDASELVGSFNSQQTISGSQNIAFRTMGGGRYFSVTDLDGSAEKMRVLPGDLQEILGLSTNEIRPIFLYLNNELLTFKGTTGSVRTANWPWPTLTQSDLSNVGISVDGVSQYFSITESDFSPLGSSVATASLQDWASVFKKKVAGVNITIAGAQLAFSTWQTNSASGSIEILDKTSTGADATWIGVNKIWSSSQELYSQGSQSDFDINRVTGQIKLLSRPPINSYLTIASENTRAEILSKTSTSGFFSMGVSGFGTPKIVIAADGQFEVRDIPLIGAASLVPSIVSPNKNLIRLDSSDPFLFANVRLNDFIYLSPNSSVSNYMTSRLNSFFRVRERGLNTRSTTESFSLAQLQFGDSGVDSTEVIISTSENHKAVVGKKVELQSTILSYSDPSLEALLNSVHEITEIVDDLSFKISIPSIGPFPPGPNSCTVILESDSYIVIEASQLEIDAFFGRFSEAAAQYTLSSNLIKVELPTHDLIPGNFLQINSVSPALGSVFPLLVGIPGPKPVVAVVDENYVLIDMGSSASGSPIPGELYIDAQYTTVFSSYDIVEGMFAAFKCENAIPAIIDFGTNPNPTADQLISILTSAIGIDAYKISPRQIAVRSNSYDKTITTLAILAVTGTASSLFETSVVSGIQSHIASVKSKHIASGPPKFQSSVSPTKPSEFYATRTSLFFEPTSTVVLNNFENPSIEAASTITEYPRGLNEVGVTGREYGHYSRIYNNNLNAPFAGFARGRDVIPSLPQSVRGTNEDESSVGIRLSDIPFGFSDSLVIEMDLDEINKTISVPMFKRAELVEMQSFGEGPGTQLTFQLRDPDDEILPGVGRPFFETNSVYRDFDFTDFNILFRPTLVHTIYPNPGDALVLRSSQFGPAHRLSLNINLPTSPNRSTISVSHVSFEEFSEVVQAVSVNLKSGPKNIGTDYTGLYTVYPSALTSPTGAEIVKLEISALSLNLSGAFKVGDILNIGSSLPYSGSFLIIETPNFDTVVVASPGIRSSSLPGPSLVYDGTLAPIQSFPIASTTAQEIVDAISSYYESSPVVLAELTETTNPNVEIKFPTYYSHGNTQVRLDLTNITESNYYHAKRSPFGSIAHIHTYDATSNQIIALVQNEEAMLPLPSEIVNTGFPPNYAGQECRLIPASPKALEKWIKFSAISPFLIQGAAHRVQSENYLQISSLILGSVGAVRIKGVAANFASSAVKSSPFNFGSSLKIRSDIETAKALPRDSIVRVQNVLRAPILRPYRSIPTPDPDTDTETQFNPQNVEPWFRNATFVDYSRPRPGFGRFVFRKTISGLTGDESVQISKINPFIAKIEIISGSGKLAARTGDMLILRGDFTSYDTSYNSIFAPENQCISSSSDILNTYIGYPVVHVESETSIYVIGPNIVPETVSPRETGFSGPCSIENNGFNFVRINGVLNSANFSVGDSVSITGSLISEYNSTYRITAISAGNYIDLNAAFTESSSSSLVISRNTTEFMFVPMLKAEKNIRTTYNAGAYKLSDWKVTPDECMFYRIKTLGNGFVYADFSFSTHSDMLLSEMSVSSEDWIEFGEVFKTENRGRFKIIAHNGKDAIIFKNDSAVDEVISTEEIVEDGKIGNTRWRIGPVSDADFSAADKRPVRIWDADSVFEGDNLLISSPVSPLSNWFHSSLIGEFAISKIGLTRDFNVFVEASIPNATSATQTILLSNSINSVKFTEGIPYQGYKWCLGYASGESDQSESEIFLTPNNLSYKISPAYSTTLISEHKLGYQTDNVTGIGGYSYYEGLIGEAHSVIDGSSENPLEYPGVRAAGTSIEVQAPLIKSISLSISIETRDGVSLSAVKNPVKSEISGFINSLGVAQPVVLSQIIRRVQNVPGVNSVVITNTFPLAEDGIIKVGSFEVPRITSQEDILI